MPTQPNRAAGLRCTLRRVWSSGLVWTGVGWCGLVWSVADLSRWLLLCLCIHTALDPGVQSILGLLCEFTPPG